LRPHRALLASAFAAFAALAGCGSAPLDAVTIDPRSLADGLVAHWTFDEGTGAVVGDHSGNGHHGQLTGGTWITEGRFGGALDLVTGNFVTVPGFPQATVDWTVSAWIWTSAYHLTMGTTEDWESIITTENVFSGGWQLQLENRPASQRYHAASWAGSTVTDYVVVYCACIEVGSWLHLTAVFDGTARELRFYRDDRLVDRQAMPMPILPGDSTLYMGRWNMPGRHLAATIDDVAIWSRVLEPAELAVLSRQPPPHLP
jgi:hypothetical protein